MTRGQKETKGAGLSEGRRLGLGTLVWRHLRQQEPSPGARGDVTCCGNRREEERASLGAGGAEAVASHA